VLLLLPSILDHVTWCQQMKMLKWQQKYNLDKKSVAMYKSIIRRPGPYLLFRSDLISQCDSTFLKNSAPFCFSQKYLNHNSDRKNQLSSPDLNRIV
jgi:hypothetical protein